MKSEQLKKMVQDAFDRLVEDVEAGKSEALVQYLKAMGRFHMYSVGNMVLISLQKPDAEKVAGFHAWKQLGRSVKKGEHGIAIMAPLLYRKKLSVGSNDNNSQEPQTKDVEYLSGFKTAYVFDISQTDGRPLPEHSRVTGDPGQYLEMLKSYVVTKGIKLQYNLLPGSTLGLSCGGTIVIKAGLSPAEECSVTVHELAHELLHRNGEGKQQNRKTKELEAESVAFVVCYGLGLQNGTASSDYIQLYHGDKAALLESLERIQKTACEILWALKNSPRYVTEDYRAENETARSATERVPVAA
jgi:antirestriction protein ArdC